MNTQIRLREMTNAVHIIWLSWKSFGWAGVKQ